MDLLVSTLANSSQKIPNINNKISSKLPKSFPVDSWVGFNFDSYLLIWKFVFIFELKDKFIKTFSLAQVIFSFIIAILSLFPRTLSPLPMMARSGL